MRPFWCNIIISFCVVDIFQLWAEMYSIVSTQTDVTLVNQKRTSEISVDWNIIDFRGALLCGNFSHLAPPPHLETPCM